MGGKFLLMGQIQFSSVTLWRSKC